MAFDCLPDIRVNMRALNGFAFNLMVVGPTGIGKTTLISSLFDFNFDDSQHYDRDSNEVKLHVKQYKPITKRYKMRWNLIETKGFNNQLDRSKIYKPIKDYIEARNEDYLRVELGKQETMYNGLADSRVHCCIYMISPTNQGLTPIDLVTMKKLHQRVCLIPVIGRSDQLTQQEIQSIKKTIRKEILDNGIEVYQSRNAYDLPFHEHELPFAVAASDEIVVENGKRHRVRCFPWGKMFIERDSDFPKLRDFLHKGGMLDLIDATNDLHYVKYRERANRDFEKFYEIYREYEPNKKEIIKKIEELAKEESKS